jgi:diguanylate cyclase (GGDEF)-like protein
MGIANRGMFEVKLEELIRNWGRHLERWQANPDYAKIGCWDVSLVLMDIDDFKEFNDRHGHRYGDYVLTEAAGEMLAELRSTDFLARYGGEELGLIMPSTSHTEARTVFDRISWRFSRSSESKLKEIVTFSAGIATLTFELYANRDFLNVLELGGKQRDREHELRCVRSAKEHLINAADWALMQVKGMKEKTGGKYTGHSFPAGNALEYYVPPV